MQRSETLTDIKSRRAEWCVVGIALILPTIVTYFYFVVFADRSPGVQYGVFALGKGIQFLLPVAWVWHKAPEKLDWSGPRRGGWRPGLSFAAVIFFLAIGLFHIVLRDQLWFDSAIAEVQAKVTAIGCDSKPAFLVLSCFYALVHSLLEEYYWRWFVFARLKLLVPVPRAILISSLGFMAHHVLVLAKYFHGISPMTVLLSLSVALGGAFWAWLYHRTGSIWPSWISHAIVDAAIFALGYQMVFNG